MDKQTRIQMDLAWARRAGWIVLAAAALACSADGVVGEGDLPPDVPAPASIETPEGAVGAYRGALASFRDAVGVRQLSFVPTAGLISDELTILGARVGMFAQLGQTQTDSRFLPQFGDVGLERTNGASTVSAYHLLHQMRGQAQQARGLLRAYAPDRGMLAGHLYAVEAYAEIYLADLYCSGIPLSTVDFAGDYTLRPGSTTQEVYEHALALFDSARTLAGDSTRVVYLAQVGTARTLLALGRYVEAAQAVAGVPDAFRYDLVFEDGTNKAPLFVLGHVQATIDHAGTMANGEGGTGLDFLTSNDPRTGFTRVRQNIYGYSQYLPTKFALDGSGVVPIASGVEARLIEAEAALQASSADGTWLARLNALRTDGTFDTQPNAGDPAKTDTLWHAGSGGVAGLRPLEDPESFDARVDLLFRERAFWLYLTGHRQGDLRRLIRAYGRNPNSVYPTGAYPGGSGAYGTDVTAPVPASERAYNPQYTGCFDRKA